MLIMSRYDAYYRAAQQFAIAATSLESKDTAAAEIDRVLTECVVRVRNMNMASDYIR